jgi:hypothetical protein
MQSVHDVADVCKCYACRCKDSHCYMHSWCSWMKKLAMVKGIIDRPCEEIRSQM